jgi:hypothetical protein
MKRKNEQLKMSVITCRQIAGWKELTPCNTGHIVPRKRGDQD